MKIPTASKDGCVPCEKHLREYDPECRGCFVREIAHMPIKHRGERYNRIAREHGHHVMAAVSDEVARYYAKNKSWATW